MTDKQEDKTIVTRDQLANLLNEDLAASIRRLSPMWSTLRC